MKTTLTLLTASVVAISVATANAQPQPASTGGGVPRLNIVDLPDNIRQEHTDRVNRLARLSKQFGAQSPQVQDDLQVNAGQIPGVGYNVPVIRVRYNSNLFFGSDSARVNEAAYPVLDVLAEAMKRDLPDTQLAIFGHTDAIGSNQYNTDLSRQRAESVLRLLSERGVNPEQMTVVPMGEDQPAAPNRTEDGRAQNRRVEFMIAKELAAIINVSVNTPVPANWLETGIVAASAERQRSRANTDRPIITAEIIGDPGDAESVPARGAGKVEQKPANVASAEQIRGAKEIRLISGEEIVQPNKPKRKLPRLVLIAPVRAEVIPAKAGADQRLWP
ncbi:OmpA family protein [Asticcacaulis sp.]|uniref:OmpA family protein n=1 Tax=Asticcacaulis sp. TaxID=1872648 RepID=UPI00261DF4CC|nr:OmpA family protein [Asticcacaulis sp.]